jgi:hypothetical protein
MSRDPAGQRVMRPSCHRPCSTLAPQKTGVTVDRSRLVRGARETLKLGRDQKSRRLPYAVAIMWGRLPELSRPVCGGGDRDGKKRDQESRQTEIALVRTPRADRTGRPRLAARQPHARNTRLAQLRYLVIGNEEGPEHAARHRRETLRGSRLRAPESGWQWIRVMDRHRRSRSRYRLALELGPESPRFRVCAASRALSSRRSSRHAPQLAARRDG